MALERLYCVQIQGAFAMKRQIWHSKNDNIFFSFFQTERKTMKIISKWSLLVLPFFFVLLNAKAVQINYRDAFNQSDIHKRYENLLKSWGCDTNVFDQVQPSTHAQTKIDGKDLIELEKKYQEVKVLVYPSPNFGKALKMGFLGAKGQYVVNFSVDWYSFNFLREALNLLNSYDIVVSSKLIGSGDQRALSRRIITRGYVFLSKSLLGLRTSDTHGIKAFNREKVIPIIQKTLSDKALFDTEWILRAERANLKIFELSAKVKEKRRSKSNLLKVGIQSFFDILKLKATLSKERELVSRKINEYQQTP